MATTTLTDEPAARAATAPVRVGTGLDPDALDRLYALARTGQADLPWSAGGPCEVFVDWLNTEAPGLIRPGSRVAVAGCGLGGEAAELLGRGFDVDAFDVSPTAVEWARQANPALGSCVTCADARTPPSRWRRRFDLVVAADLLAWVGEADRRAVAAGLASLAHPHGYVLSLERLECGADGPGLTARQAEDTLAREGLAPARPPAILDTPGAGRWVRLLAQPGR